MKLEEEVNPIWSLITTTHENLCSWQHWNVMNFRLNGKKKKRTFFGVWSRRRCWWTEKGNRKKSTSILMLPVYIQHGSMLARRVHKKHVFILMFFQTLIQEPVLIEIHLWSDYIKVLAAGLCTRRSLLICRFCFGFLSLFGEKINGFL